MHLTDQQIQSYRDNGYLAGPRVLTDEQIQMLLARIDDILAGRSNLPEYLLGQTLEKSKAKGQLPAVKVVNIFRHDEVFASIIKEPAIGEAVHGLMEAPVRVWEDQMIYKPTYDDGAVFAWHQDHAYWTQVGPPELGTCWIALDNATVDNGCMHVIPGSHKWKMNYTREDVDPTDPHWLFKQPGIPDGADLTPVPCEVKAGHCHFHHCLTFHGSYGNKTNNPRRSYILHLMPGTTRRTGGNWNPGRQSDIECVPMGAIVEGPNYPELWQPHNSTTLASV